MSTSNQQQTMPSHFSDDDLQALISAEWLEGRAAALRRHSSQAVHLIGCEACATRLALVRRAVGLQTESQPRASTRAEARPSAGKGALVRRQARPGLRQKPTAPLGPLSFEPLLPVERKVNQRGRVERIIFRHPELLSGGAASAHAFAVRARESGEASCAEEAAEALPGLPSRVVFPPDRDLQLSAVGEADASGRLRIVLSDPDAPGVRLVGIQVSLRLADGSVHGPSESDPAGCASFRAIPFDPDALLRTGVELELRPKRPLIPPKSREA